MEAALASASGPLLVERYLLFREIAAGGMASIHLARLLGRVGFGKTVAVKRLHPQFAKQRDFVEMFVDEASIATSIRHPNVVPLLDVVALPGELFLVMEYVHGEALHRLFTTSVSQRHPVPPGVVSAVGIDLLEGLHAAHEARGRGGEPLGIVHRDVSPQNVLVGCDGVARVLDFGVAKAASRVHETLAGSMKGKLRYMAPEQVEGNPIDRRIDLWAAGVILWELLTQTRLFLGDNEGVIIRSITDMPIAAPSAVAGSLPSFDEVVLKALARSPDDRYGSAHEMALALGAACPPASPREVTEWVELLAGPALRGREELLAELEAAAATGMPSVRTQLAVIADRASERPVDGVRGVRATSPNDEATAQVGGRPLTSSPSSRTSEHDLAKATVTTAPVVHKPEPANRMRVGGIVLLVAVCIVAGAAVMMRSMASGGSQLKTASPVASEVASTAPPRSVASAEVAPPSPPATWLPASASAPAPSEKPASGGRRTPRVSGAASGSDPSLHLDHRK